MRWRNHLPPPNLLLSRISGLDVAGMRMANFLPIITNGTSQQSNVVNNVFLTLHAMLSIKDVPSGDKILHLHRVGGISRKVVMEEVPSQRQMDGLVQLARRRLSTY